LTADLADQDSSQEPAQESAAAGDSMGAGGLIHTIPHSLCRINLKNAFKI
jgi:hypothetical protein